MKASIHAECDSVTAHLRVFYVRAGVCMKTPRSTVTLSHRSIHAGLVSIQAPVTCCHAVTPEVRHG